MTIQPTRKHIVVEFHDARTSSIAGLELPDGVKTEPYAVAIRCGPAVTVCKPGDRVAFLPNCGPIKMDEHQPDGSRKSVFIIHEDVIFGIFEGEPAITTGDTAKPTDLPRSTFNT